jgi:hypothetical protein
MIMGGSGGGGSSASVYPEYLQSLHSQLLYGIDVTGQTTTYAQEPTPTSMFGALQRALDGVIDTNSPYYDVDTGLAIAPFSPTDTLDTTKTYIDGFETEYDDYVAANVDDQVDLFEDATEDKHLISVNRLAASFAGINGLNSSAFHFALMGLESARLKGLMYHRSELEVAKKATVLEASKALIALHMEWAKLKIVAETDAIEQRADYKARNLQWDLDLYRMPGNLVGSIAGSAVASSEANRNRAASAIAGGLGGASLAASMTIKGAPMGPVGIGVGALLGGIAGLLS